MFATKLIKFSEYYAVQMLIHILFALGTMNFLLHFKPYESPLINKTEIYNEGCIIILTYLALCFTNFVPDPETRDGIGICYIVTNSLMLSFHILILLIDSGHTFRLLCRRYINRKRMKLNIRNKSKHSKMNENDNKKEKETKENQLVAIT